MFIVLFLVIDFLIYWEILLRALELALMEEDKLDIASDGCVYEREGRREGERD